MGGHVPTFYCMYNLSRCLLLQCIALPALLTFIPIMEGLGCFYMIIIILIIITGNVY